jgi:hypothetical protein
MGIDLLAWYAEVSDALQTRESLRDGMQYLLRYCNERDPWSGWGEIEGLDFDSGVSELENWLNSVLTKEPPPSSVKAFWFGIFEPVYDGEIAYDTYIAGADEFDPNDDESFEWACDTSYFPDGRYAHCKILHELYHILKGAGCPSSAMGEYILCLAYTAFSVRELAKRVDKKLWLGTAKQRGLAVGFDSGDAVLLEPLTSEVG